jgi:hypothetical protein
VSREGELSVAGITTELQQEFKLKITARLDAGEGGTALLIEFMIKRELLYHWRDAYRAAGLRRCVRRRLGRRSVAKDVPSGIVNYSSLPMTQKKGLPLVEQPLS